MGFPCFHLRPDNRKSGIFCRGSLGQCLPVCMGCDHRPHHVLVLRKRRGREERSSCSSDPCSDPGRRRTFVKPGKYHAFLLHPVLRIPGGIIPDRKNEDVPRGVETGRQPDHEPGRNHCQRRRGSLRYVPSSGICSLLYPDSPDHYCPGGKTH